MDDLEMLHTLFDFAAPADFRPWQPVNDVVMGGLSSSRFIPGENQTAIFEGDVSLENNGGFASVLTRGTGRFNLSGCDGITLRVRGDGRTYGFNLRTLDMASPYRFETSFNTEPGAWEQVIVPFEALTARLFGQAFPLMRLSKSRIRSFGFIIADKRSGPFRLEIDWIKAHRESEA
ncbi:MAG: CIA30 family protein [Anaerolineae bacterium]|nr:CIA30 family protein [Anaerolineae bacterium]